MHASVDQLRTQIFQLTGVWQAASWSDYEACRDSLPSDVRARLFFDDGYLLVDMGSEGPNHASVSDIFPILFFLWFSQKGGRFKSFGRCLLEKTGYQAASPDLVLYLEEQDLPKWQPGDLRRINLDKNRLPNLVAEVADTTLAGDLDEKKALYAALQIQEYWVIDVDAARIFIFRLQEDGRYGQFEVSSVLEGLPGEVLSGAIARVKEGMTDSAAAWFNQQITI